MAFAALEPPGGVAVQVLDYVRRHEGAHFREVQRGVGLATGQTDHHLRRLVHDGLLARTPLAGEVHFFPATCPRAERRPRAALLHPARARLTELLLRGGPTALGPLARRAGMPESTVVHHLRTLQKAGVAYREQEGRRVRYGPSDPQFLAKLTPEVRTEALPEAAP